MDILESNAANVKEEENTNTNIESDIFLTGELPNNMESCEKSIAEQNEVETEHLLKQYEKNKVLISEDQRHKKLMTLLKKSQFYTQFVLERIKKQELEKQENEIGKENLGSTLKGMKRVKSGGGGVLKKIKLDSKVTGNSSQTDDASSISSSVDSMDNEKVVPKLFENGSMRSYQIDGFYWMKVMFENGVNGILADEMGLGKTIQSIALICHLIEMGVSGPFLIIGPLSTLNNWINEFARFSPKVSTLLYHGNCETRAEKRRHFFRKTEMKGLNTAAAPVIITSYEVILRDRNVLSKYFWSYIIVDEGHRLKNHNCRLTQTLGSFHSTNRLILTGTPLQNDLAELWSLLNFLLPEIFDSLDVFESWFNITNMMDTKSNAKIIQQEREKQIVSTLHQILIPFLLRRVKADVDLDIPGKKEVLVYTPMSRLQTELYKATLLKDMSRFKEKEDEIVEYNKIGRPRRSCRGKYDFKVLFRENESDSQFEEFLKMVSANPTKECPKAIKTHESNIKMQNCMMQLRKVVNHPYLLYYPLTELGDYKIDEDLVNEAGKLKVLDQLLAKLLKSGNKVLLFSQMTKLLDILEDYLQLRPYFKYRRLDGRVSLAERTKDIEDFNSDEEIFIYLLSTRAGGLGINLTAADTVIIYDSDWNPQQDLQAQDRCHRIGQTKPVLILRLCTQATIDEKIIERAGTKRKLEKIILKSGKFKSEKFTKKDTSTIFNPEELLELLQKRDHSKICDTTTGNVLSEEELCVILDRSDITKKSS